MDKDQISHKSLVLKGKSVVPGIKRGRALVLSRSFSAFGGIDPFSSQIIETRHPQKGERIKRKILIFPHGKGSSGFSLYFHIMRVTDNNPKAMIINRISSLTALAAVAGNIPTISGPFDEDKNPFEIIQTGDLIEVDCTRGLIYKVF